MAGVLMVPGLGDSGPHHWQTWWQSQDPGTVRVLQEDWLTADLERWSTRVWEAVVPLGRPVWLVAHSFGCLATVRAGFERPDRIAGALLVAPAQPERFGVTLPTQPLPFPSTLVASRDDPWMSFPAAAEWARRWGSHLVDLGQAGHINADSGYGPWPEGRALLHELKERAAHGSLRRPAGNSGWAWG
ncbi:conserved protein of unknown function [Candidatus Methylocalor cossyra]|uniref:Alpha/beta hydrolase n=2 Tax=Candidatus Methylocalor cossyra TaxID=3108543 RepID=A0ABM9NMC4_9GAMM